MILSTTPKESEFHLKQRTVLGDLLMQKRKDFEKNNVLIFPFNLYDALTFAFCALFSIGSSILLLSSIFIGLSLVTLSFLLVIAYNDYFLKSKIFSRWLSGKKSKKIIEKMFMCSVADEEILRSLISVYGQEEMVNILTEKDKLTYQEVFEFMKKSDSLKDKKNKVKEVVQCLEKETQLVQ